MSSFRRLLFLGLFGSCGATVAICFALSTDPKLPNPLEIPVPESIIPGFTSNNHPPAMLADQRGKEEPAAAAKTPHSQHAELSISESVAAEAGHASASADDNDSPSVASANRASESKTDGMRGHDEYQQKPQATRRDYGFADARGSESKARGQATLRMRGASPRLSTGDLQERDAGSRVPLSGDRWQRDERFAMAPSVARTYPPVTQPATPQPAAQPPGEATLPVSAMMQLMDKILDHASKNQEPDQPLAQLPLPPPQAPEPPQGLQQPTAPAASGPNLIREEGDLISLHLHDTDIREVLELLSAGSGENILATKSVQGTVTASLQKVDFTTALKGILRSTGYVAKREDDIIYIGLPAELQVEPPASTEKPIAKIYKPNYISAAELQKLITPLLTPGIGTISVSSPAESGIPSDSVGAGGDGYANAEIVLVRDFEKIIKEVDAILPIVDQRPMQVAIEAMILSVKLDDSNKMGVDFELLRDKDTVRVTSGDPIADLNFSTKDGGLKIGFLDTSLSLFIEALETVGNTNVIATPRLMVLNKQRAEILIGSELGYVSSTVTETALTQAVEFLEVGTALRLRPFIGSDGLIRMEIHPELSTGEVRVEEGFTLPDKEVTQVTTNIIAQDGATVIIGGLIREDLMSSSTQIPFLGSLPVVGPAFRQKSEDIDRREIIVLITPHIMYEPEASFEGDLAATEFHHRQAINFQKLNPLTQRRLSRGFLHKAQRAWAIGDRQKALQAINMAIHYDPESRAAIDLRADIVNGVPIGDHTGQAPFEPLPNVANPLDGPAIAPWLLDGIDPNGRGAVLPEHPLDRGRPGQAIQVSPLGAN